MFFFPETLLTTIKEQQTITTHNTNRHCRASLLQRLCGTTLVETAVYHVTDHSRTLYGPNKSLVIYSPLVTGLMGFHDIPAGPT